MIDNREKVVVFCEISLKKSYEELKSGKFEDKQLYEFLTRAINDLKLNPFVGIKVPKKIWPKEYIQKYNINNLWKYDLPNGWRLIYTIKGDSVQLISILLEWFDHKGYERKFGY